MKDEGGRMKQSLRSSFILPTSSFQSGAGDEIRTRDPQLGRLMLYQLSYTRPTKFRNADFKLRIYYLRRNSEIRIPKSEILLVQGVGFEPT